MNIGPVAFIFQTHLISKTILAEYKKIAKACKGIGEPWLVYQGNKQNVLLDRPNIRLHQCTFDDIKSLDYPMDRPSGLRSDLPFLIPGHTHYPLAHFYTKHPEYAYYWLIEYDVRFSGKWQTLFHAFANVQADLIAAHFTAYLEEPKWRQWELSHPHHFIPLEHRWRCFHPIYRISNAAMAFICAAHKEGWRGHSEVVFATLLRKNNFSFVDFGGKGAYVLPGMENKFYTGRQPNPAGILDTGTLRWRPVHSWIGFHRNKIYHPVKIT